MSLPADVVRDASRRLGWAALVYSGTYLLAFFGPVYLFPAYGSGGESVSRAYALPTVVATASIGLGLAVFLLSRYSRIAPAKLLDLGLVFEVVGAFGISMATFWNAFPGWTERLASESINYLGIPWECAWIIAFPVLAPNTPTKTLAASLAAASTGLLAVFLSRAFGPMSPEIPMTFFVVYFGFSTYLCAGIAYVTARVIYRYGRHLSEAREIGSYQLQKPLGHGGMGQVWVARHRLLARPAALKLIRPDVLGGRPGSETVVRRFEREALATAALKSQHTVDVYDFGVTEEGDFYYVMQLLEGLDLNGLVERFGALPAGRAIYLLRQVCHSLGDAHEAGLVHRDIKPSNIIACRLGPDYDFVKVLDFGLVALCCASGTELTVEGQTAGTPAFMAPEVARGLPDIDGRADIYALGCVAFWLLTGQRVFTDESPLATIAHHLQTPPDRPSSRAEVVVPGDLEEVILACLEKDREARPADAWELDARLATCEAAGSWDQATAREWWKLHLPDLTDRTCTTPEERAVPEARLKPRLRGRRGI
ncbi:MAG: serine/threonine protein kinase [Gemmatimonadota bacterium]|nr:MAG: serine/threonine protein kinase [Gemmatimonadota bacterium]